MKRLILLRHAKSSWDDPVRRDFDRPLNDKGRRAAEAMGRHMREQGVKWDRAIASPAARVIETLAAASAGYGEAIEPDWDKRAYLASDTTLLEIVHEVADEVGSLLLSGHNSGLEDLALLLVPDGADDELRASLAEKYPTGSLAEMEFDVESWADIESESGRLTRFVRPRDLDPAFGPDRD